MQRGRIVAAIMDKENGKGSQACAICGESVDSNAQFRAYTGYVGYYIPGRAGILHRHNLSNWGKARGEHITPTENRKQQQDSRPVDPELDTLVMKQLEEGGASEASKAIARTLLRLVGTGTTAQSIGALDRLTAQFSDARLMEKPGDKETCPLCNRTKSGAIHITMSPEVELEQRQLQKRLEAEIAAKKDEA